jgi:transcriptional regulator with XRE-family HTH domain
MTENQEVRKAIYNLGGAKIAAGKLRVSTSTISKWCRNGVIPNLDMATRVSAASGFAVDSLRPRFKESAA